ncbi:DUF5689 domain-containing protein [Jiulongibacter sediminis]|uniref:DUF5689 domain-containing protein n=1 Tax=Jiulongibacter sediminis TaxID=1605367 RepID=UPI0026EEF9CA|nr:DUF5689 domain-containing protein [Jiulongibacter sediminis]
MKYLLLFLLLTGQCAFSQFFSESFSYPPGQSVTGFGWTEHSGGGSNPLQTGEGLSFGAFTNDGGILMNGGGQDVHHTFSPQNKGVVYASFLVNVQSASDDGEYFFHLGPESLGTNFRGRVFVKSSGDGMQFGVSKSSNSPNYSAQVYDLNKTYQLILKYTFFNTSGTDDKVEIFVHAEPSNIETSPIAKATDGENDSPDIGSVALRQGSSSKAATLLIDEIRVASSWNEATQLKKEEKIELVFPPSLYSFAGEAEKESVFELALSGYSSESSLFLWSPSTDVIKLSKDKEDWFDQLHFKSEDGNYFETFYIQTFPVDTAAGSDQVDFVVDNQNGEEFARFQTLIKIYKLRSNGSLPVLSAKELLPNAQVKVAGRVTASANEFPGFNYLQDETSGIRLQGDYGFQIGDSVVFYGLLSEVYDEPILVWDSTNTIELYDCKMVRSMDISWQNAEQNQGRLITLEGLEFNDQDFVFLPNTNEAFRQDGISGTARIWSKTNIDGHRKPLGANAVTGIIGQFRDQYQLYPRNTDDIESISEIPSDPLNISKEYTFDLATWNLEWFGSPSNGPQDDELQLQNAIKVMQEIDADVYVLEEITDLNKFSSLVSFLGDYSGECSPAVSGGGEPDQAQRVCFVYKNKTVSRLDLKPLLRNVPPISGYPDTFERFWASGRLPALFECEVDIDGVKRRLYIIGVHARANRSGDEKDLVYDMRKIDIQVLKDSLDQYYSQASVIMAGDYNDDVDETVVSGKSASTYKPFVDDRGQWKVLTGELSKAGHKSYIGYDDVIDHITISDELFNDYIQDGTALQLPFVEIEEYPDNTSDHLPVLSRLMLNDVLTPVEKEDSLIIYPNPTTGGLRIRMSPNQKVDAWLSDSKGTSLLFVNGFQSEIEKKLSRKMEKLNAGQYVLQLLIGNSAKSYKIVKQ